MAIKLGDIFVNVDASTKDFNTELDRAEKRANSFANVVQGVFQGIGQAATNLAINGLASLIGGINSAIDSSSDLAESINKTGAVFGNSANEIVEWSKTTADALGQSQQQALEAAGGFGNLLTSLGVTRGEAADFSRQLVELAGDLASFNNIDPTEAIDKLRAGIVGETEPLRVLGINLSAATVEAKALSLGLAETKQELTEQDKVLARFNLIMEQSINAQGDFANTAEATANATRRLSAATADLLTKFGAPFEALKNVVVNSLIDVIDTVEPYAENIIAQIAIGLTKGLQYITPVLQTMRSIFVYWLQPGSPPRLLPELVKWGTSAAGEYLSGWGKADYSALNDLGNSIEQVLRSFVDTGAIKQIDLVERVFGARNAISKAVTEFKQLGRVSSRTLDDISRAAGPAGGVIRGVVESYYDLETATRASAQAQEELNAVNQRYAGIIDPLNERLSELQQQEQLVRDAQRRNQLRQDLNAEDITPREREIIRLQLEQIEVQHSLIAINQRKATEVEKAQKNVEKAAEAEKKATDNLSIQQAQLDQRVKENQLISEQINLQNRLAESAKAAAEAANSKALAAAEKAQRELEAAFKASQREADRLEASQLKYKLQLADTPGKIAIMREELAKTTEGSAEYYDILTQIASLEQQLDRSRTTGGGLSVALPEIPDFEEPNIEGGTFGEELTNALKLLEEQAEATKLALAEDTPTPQWLVSFNNAVESATTAAGNFSTFLKAALGSEEYKRLADELKGVIDYINSFFTQSEKDRLESSDGFWLNLTKQTLDRASAWLLLFKGTYKAMILDADGAWEDYSTAFDLFGERLNRLSNGRLSEFYDSFKNWLGDVKDFLLNYSLYGAGAKLLDSFGDGMKSRWSSLSQWFTNRLQELRNKLPFSEPKDPASPLRNLGKSGESIIGQIQDGMDKMRLSIDGPAQNIRSGLQNPQATNSSSFYEFKVEQVFNGGTDTEQVRQATQSGILSAARALGLSAA